MNSDLTLANKVKLDPFWQYTEGMIYKNRGKFNQAKIRFKNYSKMSPNSYKAYVQIGLIYLLETNYNKAASYFLKAKKMNIKDKEEKKNIQYLYSYSKIFDQA